MPNLLAWLLIATAALAQQVTLRKDFDAYLESQGASAEGWSSLEPKEQSRLLEGYISLLDGEGKKDDGAIELLKRLRDPEAMRRYSDSSGKLRSFIDAKPAGGTVDAGGGEPEDSDLADREVAMAAGLSVLEQLRPPPGGGPPPLSKKPGKPATLAAPGAERATLEDVGARSWGRELLDSITEDWAALDIRTRSGAVLTVEYGDLSSKKERADAEIRPKSGQYRIVVDRAIQDTEAEVAIKAHELSHIRDAEELPDARPEWMGLLMEYRANLYELATYLERHPDIRTTPAPTNFYVAEVWFKAKVYAGGLDASFPAQIPSSGPWSQVRARAQRIVDACARAKSADCGGTQALRAWVIDPIYADTEEGNILTWDITELEEPELIARDRALAYEAETRELDNRVRTRYGLQP